MLINGGCEKSLPMRSPSPHLELRAVTRRFALVAALQDVSLEVAQGQIVCLAGHSGCGKSTLLRVIAGLDRPDAGAVLINGHVVSGKGIHVEPEHRRVGFMFQDYALFPHLSVTDNVLFGLRSLERKEAHKRSDEIVGRLRIHHLVNRFPHMLSGGEQQRVALARALAPRPDLLLMDEPFSNLDRDLRDAVRLETLGLLRELGTTVIMVTHDPEEALSAGDRVVLMRRGHVEQSGTGAELYDRPNSAYAAEFFSAFNKLPGRCRNGFVDTPLGRFPAAGLSEGQDGLVYVRPRDLQLRPQGQGAQATVLDHELRGEVEQVRVTVAAHLPPLVVRSSARLDVSAGQEIGLSADPQRVLVFPASA